MTVSRCMSSVVQVVHDKGTYDAWRLGDNAHDAYMSEVWRVLEDGGMMVLSCVNWTAEELERLFCVECVPAKFELVKVLKGSSFRFGGVVGHNVVTVVFRRLHG